VGYRGAAKMVPGHRKEKAPRRARLNAVQLPQVEGVQEGAVLLPTLAQRLEDGQALLIAAHGLPVDQA
jgi:hypothetical protein